MGRIVHQKVDLSESRNSIPHDGEAMLRVFDVAGHQDAFAAGVFNQALRLLSVFMFIIVAHQDIGTFACKRKRNRTADPTVRARDYRLLPARRPEPL